MDSDSVAPSDVDPPVFELEPDDEDEEWDELSSDERLPGESLLPSLRLESIIQADGVMGSLALSKEGLFILSVATEEFIKRLSLGGHRQASAERRTTVDYRDMAATTQQYQEFMFLQETIPVPVSLSEALQLREQKEKEILEDDPALTAPTTYSSTVAYTPSTSKPKPKNRVSNGKDKQSRGGSSSRSESRAQSQVPSVNGHTPVPPRSREAESIPTRQHPNYWQRSASPWSKGVLETSASRQSDSVTNGHAPAQLQADPSAPADGDGSFTIADTSAAPIPVPGDPMGPLSLVAQNPGRTIYSQKKAFPMKRKKHHVHRIAYCSILF
ncbi:hypothetical protein C8R43DRAFT_177522 [Mycena crocata]|nr:hypothetical protein C8R43DRAFT_177522 [Mycena crocata]